MSVVAPQLDGWDANLWRIVLLGKIEAILLLMLMWVLHYGNAWSEQRVVEKRIREAQQART